MEPLRVRSEAVDAGLLPRRPIQAPDAAAGVRSMGTVAVLLLAQTAVLVPGREWLRRVVQGVPLRDVPGLRFWKLLGSGHDGGFGLRPSFSRQGLFLGFSDEPCARAFVEQSQTVARYRARARECCVLLLRAASSRGSWNGAAMPVTATLAPGEPLAVLTRASIRWSRLLDFWRLAPASAAALERSAGCRLAIGLGEAPVLRQCTFSVWDDAASMETFAHGAAHRRAVRAAHEGGFFSESMFARFSVLELRGTWKGRRYGG